MAERPYAFKGQSKLKHTSFSRFAADPNLAAVQLNQTLGDGQTESGTLPDTFCGWAQLIESVENRRVFRFRYADARVRHPKQRMIFRAPSLYRDGAAVRGELDRVTDQVVEDLVQPNRIGKDVTLGAYASTMVCFLAFARERNRSIQPAIFSDALNSSGCTRKPARFDFAEIQGVADQCQ